MIFIYVGSHIETLIYAVDCATRFAIFDIIYNTLSRTLQLALNQTIARTITKLLKIRRTEMVHCTIVN